MGPLISLFWTSGNVYNGFQSQGRSPDLRASSPVCSGLLTFTLWCDTCRPFDGEHGRRAIFDPLTCSSFYKHGQSLFIYPVKSFMLEKCAQLSFKSILRIDSNILFIVSSAICVYYYSESVGLTV